MHQPLKTYYTYNGTVIEASSTQAAAYSAYCQGRVILWSLEGSVWVEHVLGSTQQY